MIHHRQPAIGSPPDGVRLPPATVMISCGEPSGDLYAGALVAELLNAAPETRVFGLGGERLRRAGATLVADYRGLAVTGLAEAVRVVPRSLVAYRRLVAQARAQRPDVFVAIDFPDFNFRLARALKRLEVPVVYYVAPQLWAWRAGRLRTMKQLADRVLVIFPFEEPMYRDAGVPVEFVGHPLRDALATGVTREEYLRALNLTPGAPTVALLPGSRPNEVRAIFPDLVRTAALIVERLPQAQFVVARAPGLETETLGAARAIPTDAVRIVDAATDHVLASSDVGLIASGTATIQAAMHGCPMVVVYRVAPLTYLVGKPFVRVSTYAMVNLVAGRTVVPELIQDEFTPAAAAREALSLLTDAERVSEMRAALAEVRAKLGPPGASRRAAEQVLRVATSTRARVEGVS